MSGSELWSLWRFEPLPLGLTLAAVLLYLAGTGPLRNRIAPGHPFPTGRAALFLGAMALLTLVFVSPLHTLGEFVSLAAHMATTMIVVFVVPPLALLGIPEWLLAPLLRVGWLRATLRFLTRPWVNVLHFNLAFALIHLPGLLRAMLFGPDLLHYGFYFALFGSATLMWWTVIQPAPRFVPGPGTGGTLLYLLIVLLAHNPFASVFSFYPGLLYPWYQGRSELIGLTALQDQQIAGAVMGTVTITALLIAMAAVFASGFGRAAQDDERIPSRTGR